MKTPEQPISWSDLVALLNPLEQGGAGNPVISDCAYDSRTVEPGAVFVAIAGFSHDGMRYIDDAVERGAVAVIADKPVSGCTLPWARVENARAALGAAAKAVWNVSLDSICTVGVTGTNGKTTVAHLFQRLFAEQYGAKASWMSGTVTYVLGDRPVEASRTTPESADLFRRIGQAREKPRALTMEVSSHALELRRVAGFAYDLAVWTNLTQDHLDFHGDMQRYYQSKKLLFTEYLKPGGRAIVNIDDAWGRRLVDELRGISVCTYGYAPDADVCIESSEFNASGTTLTLKQHGKSTTVSSSLVGTFNALNSAACYAGAHALGMAGRPLRRALAQAAVPGRMEVVPLSRNRSAIVDYAHTPDALEKALGAVRPLTPGRVICVFGCGGDRDRAKRPLMAAAVARLADEAVVTSDNPRSEKPEAIIEEIMEGFPLDFPAEVVIDRREAIGRALTRLGEGDCLIIAGKGHETYQETAGVRRHFDDRGVVRELDGAGTDVS